ncbi:OmpA family protein [Leptospira interrogans]|uniref:Endoflagellar motor protein B n=14 Tax=Leptospira TaxID=171 RepID=Q8F432_LEPIN|nr:MULTISPECIES: OmpA family protein [Leptospira]APH41576.1 Motility protein B [Leptospira interrogans serovar Copenhageni/Icterohaemorrhagiae]AAN49414.2 endoflagellar motor protein B [Leptospira interrogans serovar Lai str. 56601]AER02602.1 endoflagellar motor protein B [Leptospira interrogans serovar Lai str. IPAV]AJR14438.1 endoflagellar motor protein [Leptospira interrogans serovar Linhai str. 56609]AKP25980.1 endoflagellar motor protein [Leptospira interrogans serovar Manilae]
MKPFLKFYFLFVLTLNSVSADVFYYPWEYNKVYNEKITLEIELDSLRTRYRNETENSKKERLEFDSKIRSLEELLSREKEFRAKDNDLNIEKIKVLENQIAVLKTKSSNKEKELIDENEKQSKKFRDLIDGLKEDLERERENCQKKTEALQKEYERKISDLESRILVLNDEISKLKHLSENQKKELDRLSDQANELENKLTDEIKKGQIRLKRFHDRLVINIDDKISFDSGSADLKKQILPALDKIKEILGNYPGNLIIIEGHTDNVPIRTKKFSDNWQLSGERALSVLHYFLESKILDPRNFSLAGYGEFQPIVSNDTPENRALNRRVDIVVVPR